MKEATEYAEVLQSSVLNKPSHYGGYTAKLITSRLSLTAGACSADGTMHINFVEKKSLRPALAWFAVVKKADCKRNQAVNTVSFYKSSHAWFSLIDSLPAVQTKFGRKSTLCVQN